MTTTQFWWLRHAPVVDNGGRVYGGAEIDADVSDRATFQALAGRLPRKALFIASGLSRARQTLLAVRAEGRNDIPKDMPRDPALNEQSLGDWHGESIAEVFPNGMPWPGFWMLDADTRPPGGESFVDVCARVAEAVDRMRAEHSGQTVVVAAHGGVIRAALAQALGLPPATALAFSVANCSVTRINHLTRRNGDVAWQVAGVNLPAI